MTTWIELMNPFKPELGLDTPSNRWVKKSFTRMLPAERESASSLPPSGSLDLPIPIDKEQAKVNLSFLDQDILPSTLIPEVTT